MCVYIIRSVPINQTETMLTLYGAFYDTTIKGIAKFGQDYTKEEAMDYLHLWSVVGYFLGVDESLLCTDDSQWENIDKRWYEWYLEHEYIVDENTKLLTMKLNELQRELIPFEFADDLSYLFIRYFMGDEYCDNLGLPKGDNMDKLMVIFKNFYGAIDEMGDRDNATQKILGKISHVMIDNIFKMITGDGRVPYYLHTSNSQGIKP